MYFAKDEIIILNDNKKYLVLDTAIIDNNVYYKIKEVNFEENEPVGEEIYITTINQEGKIFINNKFSPEEIETIKDNFES